MAMAVVLATGASTAHAATATCGGVTAKIRNSKVIRGGPGTTS